MWNLFSSGGSSVVANLDTTKLTDEGSTRTVLVVAGILVIAAFVLIGVTVWFWRNTVPDPDALESLIFFEERVVDGEHEPDVVQRQRMERTIPADGRNNGLDLPVRYRRRFDPSADPTEVSERLDGRRSRRRNDR
jgi:hypothetical protein